MFLLDLGRFFEDGSCLNEMVKKLKGSIPVLLKLIETENQFLIFYVCVER